MVLHRHLWTICELSGAVVLVLACNGNVVSCALTTLMKWSMAHVFGRGCGTREEAWPQFFFFWGGVGGQCVYVDISTKDLTCTSLPIPNTPYVMYMCVISVRRKVFIGLVLLNY